MTVNEYCEKLTRVIREVLYKADINHWIIINIDITDSEVRVHYVAPDDTINIIKTYILEEIKNNGRK